MILSAKVNQKYLYRRVLLVVIFSLSKCFLYFLTISSFSLIYFSYLPSTFTSLKSKSDKFIITNLDAFQTLLTKFLAPMTLSSLKAISSPTLVP